MRTRVWTLEQDAQILAARKAGIKWRVLAAEMGVRPDALYKHGQRLIAGTLLPAPAPAPEPPVTKIDTRRDALPAGSPETWNAICGDPFPNSNRKSQS